MNSPHIPVLLDAVLNTLVPAGRKIGRVVDGTLGAGGHARALLEAGVESVLGLDVDPAALVVARQNLESFGERARIIHASYADMPRLAAQFEWDRAGVDGILLDLGVSSMQLDTAERGFSFMRDGPLDMRFDSSSDRPTAAELVNYWDEQELGDIFFRYGEERHSRQLARVIVQNRPFETTQQLAAVIEQASRRSKSRTDKRAIHPATRIFQALRIAVNDELGILEQVLPAAIQLLRSGGRLAVISFHSLEDRIVKQVFKDASTAIISPPGMVLEEKAAVVRMVTRKPIMADVNEMAQNPRSRSAKLRVVEKI